MFTLPKLVARGRVHPSWVEVLDPVAYNIARLGELLQSRARAGEAILPDVQDVFRAFSYPFGNVKVLILGQDPYPTPGVAVGLSFSTRPSAPLPASLQNIFRELGDDLNCAAPRSGDLTPWCDSGVMLLNRVLTVASGKPGSHAFLGWEEVTAAAIQALACRPTPLAAILWGKKAGEARTWLQGKQVRVIASPHPSPLSARSGFFGSRPFSRANEYLRDVGQEPVDWQICSPRA